MSPQPFISGGIGGEGIVCTGSILYVTKPGSVEKYDKATGTHIGTLSSGYGYLANMSLTPDGNFIYITDSNNGKISKINTITGATVASVTQSAAHDVVARPGGKVYVSNPNTGEIRLYDSNLTTSVPFISGPSCNTGFTFANDGTVWVDSCAGSTVYHYDANGNPIGSVTDPSLNFSWGNAIGPDGNLYVTTLTTLVANLDSVAIEIIATIAGY